MPPRRTRIFRDVGRPSKHAGAASALLSGSPSCRGSLHDGRTLRPMRDHQIVPSRHQSVRPVNARGSPPGTEVGTEDEVDTAAECAPALRTMRMRGVGSQLMASTQVIYSSARIDDRFDCRRSESGRARHAPRPGPACRTSRRHGPVLDESIISVSVGKRVDSHRQVPAEAPYGDSGVTPANRGVHLAQL